MGKLDYSSKSIGETELFLEGVIFMVGWTAVAIALPLASRQWLPAALGRDRPYEEVTVVFFFTLLLVVGHGGLGPSLESNVNR